MHFKRAGKIVAGRHWLAGSIGKNENQMTEPRLKAGMQYA